MNKRTATLTVIAFLIILIGAIAAVLIASELTDDDDSKDTASENTGETPEDEFIEDDTNNPINGVVSQPQVTPPEQDTTNNYDITMSNFTFSPNIIEASPGETLTISLTSLGGTHDFVIDELDVQSLLLGSNESQDLTITIPDNASGMTYQFYCSVGNHREMGMVGEIRVI
jgi:plastocyanin